MLYSGIALVSDPSDKEGGNSHQFPKNRVLSPIASIERWLELSDKNGYLYE